MIRSLFADLLAYFVVPAFIALLPARFGMRVSRRFVRHTRLYAHEAGETFEQAKRKAAIADPAAWIEQNRLMRLRDHVDMFHWLFWGHRWYRRHVQVDGTWPSAPFVAVTFHWGGALWGLHSLRQHTGGFAGVAAPPPWSALRHRPVLYGYLRLRNRINERLLGDGLVNPGGAARLLVRKLRAGVAICGLWDSPASGTDKTLAVSIQGQRLRLPRGLPAMAAREHVRLVVFFASTDPATGEVRLVIRAEPDILAEQQGAERLAAVLDEHIAAAPALWHHWYLLNLPQAGPHP